MDCAMWAAERPVANWHYSMSGCHHPTNSQVNIWETTCAKCFEIENNQRNAKTAKEILSKEIEKISATKQECSRKHYQSCISRRHINIKRINLEKPKRPFQEFQQVQTVRNIPLKPSHFVITTAPCVPLEPVTLDNCLSSPSAMRHFYHALSHVASTDLLLSLHQHLQIFL